MKMCAALARAGHDVRLVAKAGREPGGTADVHARYQVEPAFAVDLIARPALRGGSVVYGIGMAARLVRYRRWADLVYCRDPVGAVLAAELGLPVVFEAHDVPVGWLRRGITRVLRRPHALGVVAITEALRRDLVGAGISHANRPVVVAPDACDPPVRSVTPRRPREPPVIGYVGSLYQGRGVELIAELARRMPDRRFQLVGGAEPDLARWRASEPPANFELLGFRPQPDLPAAYAGFDVVLMPYATTGIAVAGGGTDTSPWASPMKMFEYMASGVAMIASDLPVLQEVLRDGDNAIILPAADVVGWHAAIERLLADDDLRYRLAKTAQDDLIRSYTWDARARTVLTGLGLG
jgi:glycosyltransferase involved in cell wall biosynthesis